MKRLALLGCLGFAQLAHAAGEIGGYIGAALGTFDYDESDLISDSTSAYQLFGGYQFSDHFAVEFGVGRTGDIEGTFTEMIPGIGPVTLEVDATYDIYAVKALGYIPFDQLSLFGSAGYASASFGGPVNLQGFGQVGVIDGHERGAALSGGIQYDFGLDLKSFSIRGEYQWFDFGSEIDASTINVAVLFRF